MFWKVISDIKISLGNGYIHSFNYGGILVPETEQPTTEELLQLYEAAVDFKNEKCWKWMHDTDIFGVVDPETGETGYCCIIGNNGEHYAIAAYLGSEGLKGYFEILSESLYPRRTDRRYTQHCLMCSFEDRETLDPEDLKVIKELGLKFQGRNEWPLFRIYEPGMFPWFLNSSQIRFLTHILQQALQVSMRCAEDPMLLQQQAPDKFFVRTPRTVTYGEYIWEDHYLSVTPPRQKYASFTIENEILLRKMNSITPHQNMLLEADTFFLPAAVTEMERPYYPKACIIVCRTNGSIIGYDILQDIRTEGYKCIELLTKYIEKTGLKPSTLFVAREETYHLFLEACKQLGIKLNMTDRLYFIEEEETS